MRFRLLLITAALPLAPIRVAISDAPQSAYDACRIAPDGRSFGPSADICAQVVQRWESLIPGHQQPGGIRVEKRVGYAGQQVVRGAWKLLWPMPERAQQPDAVPRNDGLLRYFAENVIPHEAGHQVFAMYLRDVYPRDGATTGYGVPDWFIEAQGVWMESDAGRAQRMRSIQGSAPSLVKVMSMTNPFYGARQDTLFGADFTVRVQTTSPPCPECTFFPDSLRTKYRVTATGTRANGKTETLTRWLDHDPAGGAFEDKHFHSIAYSLLRFIHARGGTAAVTQIIARYRANPKQGASVLVGVTGMPANTVAIEQAWHAFLRTVVN